MVLDARWNLDCRLVDVNNGTGAISRRYIKLARFLRSLYTTSDLTPTFALKTSFTVSKWACGMQLPPKSKYERREWWWCVCVVVCMFWECTYSLAPNGCGCIVKRRWLVSALHARALFKTWKSVWCKFWMSYSISQRSTNYAPTAPNAQYPALLFCRELLSYEHKKWKTMIRLQSYTWSDWFRTRRRCD